MIYKDIDHTISFVIVSKATMSYNDSINGYNYHWQTPDLQHSYNLHYIKQNITTILKYYINI